MFNEFFDHHYPEKKRYGCEGIDSFVSGMAKAMEVSYRHKIRSVEIGMAHRGRLNVLTLVAQKPFHQIFGEFD